MDKLNYKEVYVMKLLSTLNNLQDVNDLTNKLQTFYAYAFLDELQSIQDFSLQTTLEKIQAVIDEFFLNPQKVWSIGDSLYPTIQTLGDSNLIDVDPINRFDSFTLSQFSNVKYPLLDPLSHELVMEILKSFQQSFQEFAHKYDNHNTKFEVRYFWSSDHESELIDCAALFKQNEFKYSKGIDKYFLSDPQVNIKMREDKLQVKECIQTIHNIAQFTQKKEIPFPLKTHFFDIDNTKSIEVEKERYTCKLGHKTKAEFSNISVNGKTWKTICFESKSFLTALALSLLIRSDKAERLTYSEFLFKYGLDKS